MRKRKGPAAREGAAGPAAGRGGSALLGDRLLGGRVLEELAGLRLGGLHAQTRRWERSEETLRAAAGILQQLADEFPTRPDYRSLLAA